MKKNLTVAADKTRDALTARQSFFYERNPPSKVTRLDFITSKFGLKVEQKKCATYGKFDHIFY